MKKLVLTFTTAAAVAVLLAGCSAPKPHVTGVIDSTAGPSATAIASATPTPAPTPTVAPGQGDNSTKQGPAAAALTASGKTSASALAATAMKLYARQNVTPSQWLSDLSPYLTPQAASDFQGTDPTLVKVHTVGAISIDPASTGNGALLIVKTDAGDYRLVLLSSAGNAGWLVAEITQA